MQQQPVIGFNRATRQVQLWDSTRQAERDGFDRRSIWKVAHGHRRSHRGLRFWYV